MRALNIVDAPNRIHPNVQFATDVARAVWDMSADRHEEAIRHYSGARATMLGRTVYLLHGALVDR